MTLEGFTDVSSVLRCGVYALIAKGTVIYVGKSKAMISRIDNHRKVWAQKRQGKESWISENLGIPGILFDEVHICPCRPDQVDELERAMITRYQPRYNVRLRTPGKLPEVMVIAGVQVSLVPRKQPVMEPLRRI